MTRPGLRLRALSARWFSERTRQRLIDPALADLQVEYAEARRSGSRGRAVWMLMTGYTALAKALLLAGLGELAGAAQAWRPEETEGLRRGARAALVSLTLATALLMVPILAGQLWPLQHVDWNARGVLVAYLIPSLLSVSAPFSLALAVGWTLSGAARTRKMAATALVIAALLSAALFANLLWVVPEANQAFRQRVYAALAPDATSPARGLNELTWTETQDRRGEVRARGDAREVRSFETWYYRRFALSLAPLALVALVVAIAFRRLWTRAGLTSVTLAVYAVNHVLMMSVGPAAHAGILPPIVLGWSADAVCAVAALLLALGPRSAAASPSPPAPTR